MFVPRNGLAPPHPLLLRRANRAAGSWLRRIFLSRGQPGLAPIRNKRESISNAGCAGAFTDCNTRTNWEKAVCNREQGNMRPFLTLVAALAVGIAGLISASLMLSETPAFAAKAKKSKQRTEQVSRRSFPAQAGLSISSALGRTPAHRAISIRAWLTAKEKSGRHAAASCRPLVSPPLPAPPGAVAR